jgi:hypothetical protein
MWPIYKAGQIALEEGLCPPCHPLSNPLITVTSQGCCCVTGCDGQPVKEIVSALAGLVLKASTVAFPKFTQKGGEWAAWLPNWAGTGFRINVTSGNGPEVVGGTKEALYTYAYVFLFHNRV